MRSAVLVFLLVSCSAFAQSQPQWVTRSNQNTQILIDIESKYAPEDASQTGVRGLDDQITILTPERHDNLRADLVKARDQLKAKLAAEKDPLVRQDLEILIQSADRSIRNNDAVYSTFLAYSNVGQTIFSGIKGLLDDQMSEERRAAAVIRLKKYTGLEPGFTAMTTMAEARFRERLNTPGLLGPPKQQVEKDLGDTNTYITGIGLLLEKYQPEGLSGCARETESSSSPNTTISCAKKYCRKPAPISACRPRSTRCGWNNSASITRPRN